MGRLVATSLTVLLLSVSHGAFAQGAAPARSGFFFGAGAGIGSIDLAECVGCGGEGGLGGFLVVGGTVNVHFRLGVETSALLRVESPGTTVFAGHAAASAWLYPSATGHFFVRGGLGVATVISDGGGEFGPGAVLGLGYDLHLSRGVSITPDASLALGSAGGRSVRTLLLGVGIVAH